MIDYRVGEFGVFIYNDHGEQHEIGDTISITDNETGDIISWVVVHETNEYEFIGKVVEVV